MGYVIAFVVGTWFGVAIMVFMSVAKDNEN